jgi:hypothetical protein
MPGVSAFVGTIALGLCTWIPAASSHPPAPPHDQARYQPIQSISYAFGSKSMSGYFVEQSGICLVTLMVIEKSDPEEPLPLSPVRVRLILSPGQVAGLDSEEGRSLNVTCGEGGKTLLVDVGDRDSLVALQALALEKAAAEARGLAQLP